MRKRLVSLVTCMILILTLVPIGSFAEETPESMFTWDGNTVTGYIGSDTNITIPSRAIGIGFFSANYMTQPMLVESMVIPKSVTSVAPNAFMDSMALKLIVVQGKTQEQANSLLKDTSLIGSCIIRVEALSIPTATTTPAPQIKPTVQVSVQTKASVLSNKVMVNGKYLTLDVAPSLIEGRMLVPLRAIFESLGAQVEWIEETTTVKAAKGNIRIELQIDNKKATVNGVEVLLDVPAMLVSGRTLVPVRFVAESMKADVTWDSDNKTAVVKTVQNPIGQEYRSSGKLLYEGEMLNGKANGIGKVYYESGTLQTEGSYVDDKIDGYGKYYFGNGNIYYVGDIVKGLPQGSGKMFRETDGSLAYEGQVIANEMSGKGKYTITKNGKTIIYEGDFVKNIKQGKGIIKVNGNLFYDGDFKDGNISGMGKTYNESGKLIYDGGYLNNKYFGTGTLYDNNGKSTTRSFSTGGTIQRENEESDNVYQSWGRIMQMNQDYELDMMRAMD